MVFLFPYERGRDIKEFVIHFLAFFRENATYSAIKYSLFVRHYTDGSIEMWKSTFVAIYYL